MKRNIFLIAIYKVQFCSNLEIDYIKKSLMFDLLMKKVPGLKKNQTAISLIF